MRPSPPPRRLWPFLRSIRARLVFWNALTLAVLLALLGLIVRFTVRAELMASVDRDLRDRARRFMGPPPGAPRPRFLPPMMGGGPPGAPPEGPPEPQPGEPPGVRPEPRFGGPPEAGRPPFHVRILSADGTILEPLEDTKPWDAAAAKLALSGPPVLTTTTAEDEPVRVLSARIPGPDGEPRVVQIPYPLADVNRALSELNRTLLALIPVALLGAGLGAALLTGSALRPVRRITATAGRISGEDLSERLPVTGDDEFSDLSATFNAMLARLETSFGDLRAIVEQQRRFTADASHELRTPLTVIKANASLALQGAPEPEEYRQSMEEIDRAADAASRLVRDLLLLARADAGQLRREAVDVPLREVITRAVTMAAQPDGAPIRVRMPDNPVRVPGSEDELVRLFTNLLENAIRYTPADGSITVTVEREDSTACIRVSDTGPGVAPEHLAHLSERFYRADPSRTRPTGGTGLGLAIARSIAEAHGGSLVFDSVPGEGLTVTVTLPVAP